MKRSLDEISGRLRAGLIPFLGFCVLAYFSYHTVQGQHGLISQAKLSEVVSRLDLEVSAVRSKRIELSNKIALLSLQNVDRDMLDERARRILGLSHRDDIIIYRSQKTEASEP